MIPVTFVRHEPVPSSLFEDCARCCPPYGVEHGAGSQFESCLLADKQSYLFNKLFGKRYSLLRFVFRDQASHLVDHAVSFAPHLIE